MTAVLWDDALAASLAAVRAGLHQAAGRYPASVISGTAACAEGERMEDSPVCAVGEVRVLIEGLLEDDSFPRAGATLAANPALLTPAADDVMAALLRQAEQHGDGDRAVMISQFRAFAEPLPPRRPGRGVPAG